MWHSHSMNLCKPRTRTRSQTSLERLRATVPKSRMGRNIAVGSLRSLLVLLFLVSFFLSVFPAGRSALRSLFLLPAMITATQPAPLIATGEPIQHTQMTIPSQSGPVYLDIYDQTTPDPLIVRARSGVLIVSGVGDNREEPQLLNLSESLARTGLVVMNMTTPTLMSYNVSVQDTDATVQAFQKLENLPGMQARRSGMIAFSAGVPLACFAAADPRIRDSVAYLADFGGYFDTKTLLRAFGRRSLDIDGTQVPWQPIDIPIEVLTNMTIKNFAPDEQDRLRQALAPNSATLTPNDMVHLSPGAQAVYHLLKGDAPQQVDANMALLPADMQRDLDQLSPSRVVAAIHAPVFLLHDRNDHSLPVTETRAFDAALTKLNHPHEYVEFHIFDHVEVRPGLNIGQLLGDGTSLFRLLDNLLYAGS